MSEWLLNYGSGLVSGLVLKSIYSYTKEKLPNMIHDRLGANIDKAFYAGDDIDDMWMLNNLIWAQMKFEKVDDAATLKYAAVAEIVVAKLKPMLPIWLRPFLNVNNARVKEIIDASVTSMKATSNEKIAQYFNGALHTYWRYAPESKRAEFMSEPLKQIMELSASGKTQEEILAELSKKEL